MSSPHESESLKWYERVEKEAPFQRKLDEYQFCLWALESPRPSFDEIVERYNDLYPTFLDGKQMFIATDDLKTSWNKACRRADGAERKQILKGQSRDRADEKGQS